MAVEKFSQMPRAIALNGGELICVSQQGNPFSQQLPTVTPWITKVVTVDLLAEYIARPSVTFVRMDQLFMALRAVNLYSIAFNQLPSDVANQFNIAWFHALEITPSDPFVTGFLQPAIDYSDDQIEVLFSIAGGMVDTCTMRQLIEALASLGLLYDLFSALPADVQNVYNIRYNQPGPILISDPFITWFLQPALDYSEAQTVTLFALASSFPK